MQDTITKVDGTKLKIETTHVNTQIVSVTDLKARRNDCIVKLSQIDQQRQNIVDAIARIDNIIAEASKQGITEASAQTP